MGHPTNEKKEGFLNAENGARFTCQRGGKRRGSWSGQEGEHRLVQERCHCVLGRGDGRLGSAKRGRNRGCLGGGNVAVVRKAERSAQRAERDRLTVRRENRA